MPRRRRDDVILEHLALHGTTLLQSLPSGDGLIGLAVLFLILAFVAVILGAKDVAGVSVDIAQVLVVIFVVLAVASFVL